MAGERDGSGGRISCLGEALIDLLPIEEEGRTIGFRMHPGGSPFNVAVAISRVGGPAAFVGKLSTDAFGRRLRATLERERVSLAWTAMAAAPSTLAFVTVDAGEPDFAFYGDGTADTLLRPEDLPEALFERTAILHVGSISLLRGTTPEAALAACERLAGRALVSLDPNVRPALVADEPAYRRTLDRLLALTDVLKISAADLAWLAPRRAPERAAVDLLADGPALVLVTHGADGVLAVRSAPGDARPSVRREAAFPVEVADTVGAGDAFQAGLLTWLFGQGVTTRAALEALSDDRLAEGLRFAAAVAALACTRPGADPPTLDVVEAFLADLGPEI